MATAKKNVVEVPDPPYTVTLELTQDEAETLKWVLGKLHYKSSTGTIYNALNDVKVPVKRPSFNPFTIVDTTPFND